MRRLGGWGGGGAHSVRLAAWMLVFDIGGRESACDGWQSSGHSGIFRSPLGVGHLTGGVRRITGHAIDATLRNGVG